MPERPGADPGIEVGGTTHRQPDLPEEAVEAARLDWNETAKPPHLPPIDIPTRFRSALNAAAPAIEEKARKQERERLAAEGMDESLEGLAEVADALEKALGGPQFEHDVRVVYVRMLALELPAMFVAIRKEERERVREVLLGSDGITAATKGWMEDGVIGQRAHMRRALERALAALEDSDGD